MGHWLKTRKKYTDHTNIFFKVLMYIFRSSCLLFQNRIEIPLYYHIVKVFQILPRIWVLCFQGFVKMRSILDLPYMDLTLRLQCTIGITSLRVIQ